MSEKTSPTCSFCDKPAREVAKLIAGPSVNICNECVTLCASILVEEGVEHGIVEPSLRAMEKMAEQDALRDTHKGAAKGLIRVMHDLNEIASSLGAPSRSITRCVWCDEMLGVGDDIRSHAASCEKHPAVIRLREIEAAQPKEKT